MTGIDLNADLGEGFGQWVLGDDDGTSIPDTETAILADPLLTDDQRTSLLAVYRSYTAVHRSAS